MTRRSRELGYTMFELLIVLVLTSILAATAIANLKKTDHPLADSALSVDYLFHLARTKAIASTKVIQIAPSSSTSLAASSSDSCSGTMIPIPSMAVELREGCTLPDTSWSVCFNQRGLADASVAFQILDSQENHKTIRVALGGVTKITD